MWNGTFADDSERARRKHYFERITAMHQQIRRSHSLTEQLPRERKVELDRQDERRVTDELGGETSRARTDLDDDLVGKNLEGADQLSRVPWTEEMPAACGRDVPRTLLAHGRPP